MAMKACGLLLAAALAAQQAAAELRRASAFRNLGPDRNAYDLVHLLDVAGAEEEVEKENGAKREDGAGSRNSTESKGKATDSKSGATKGAGSSNSTQPKGNASDSQKPEAELRREVVPRETFMPQCLAHVGMLLTSLDREYTDIHLKTVLMSECKLDQHFPNRHKSGFSHFSQSDACEEFAVKLVEAREENLKDGTIGSYESFCQEYYHIKYKDAPKKAEVKSAAPALRAWAVALLLAWAAGLA